MTPLRIQPEQEPSEPWVPDSLNGKLVVGALVRIRVNEECPGRMPVGSDGSFFVPHKVLAEQGVIQAIDGLFEGHPYQVAWESGSQRLQNHFAAVELEPL